MDSLSAEIRTLSAHIDSLEAVRVDQTEAFVLMVTNARVAFASRITDAHQKMTEAKLAFEKESTIALKRAFEAAKFGLTDILLEEDETKQGFTAQQVAMEAEFHEARAEEARIMTALLDEAPPIHGAPLTTPAPAARSASVVKPSPAARSASVVEPSDRKSEG
jgi:hypothetical protein